MKKLNLISLAVVVALAGCSDDDDNSPKTLTVENTLAVGSEQCVNGGTETLTGEDSNDNGELDSAEVTDTTVACNAPATSLTASQLAPLTDNEWFKSAQVKVATSEENIAAVVKESGKAKNVILFVGDGMGISTVTAARIMAGQLEGKLGEEHQLSFETLPFSGFAKTYNVDAQTPDSAGTMTAMASGVKTDAGVIGVDEDIERGNCATVAGNELVTATELAEIAGKSTGIVSTARITHATPAATYAKSADRNWEDVSDMPEAAVTAGCEDIASQLVNFEANLEARYEGLDVDGLEVVMGGGRRHFLPKDAAFNSADAVSSVEGDRTDGRDLTAEWKAKYPAGQYVMDQAGFDAIDAESTERVFGLFNESHMQYEADRANDVAGEPSLAEMTAKAIDVLDNNANGFMLTVEAGRIDHGHHAGNAYNALSDTVALSKAVQVALDKTSIEDTLIIVTADHSHVFTIAGYPKRGNPILGKVVPVGSDEPSLAADNMPYTTVGYTNGGGFRNLGDETDADAGYNFAPVTGRVDLTDVDTTTPGFHQEAVVPLGSETHAAEDVGVYAVGPGAHLVTGTNEQSLIFHVMDYAADLVKQADAKLAQ
ncbi:alkaline phosphatase [Pseudoalteromonas shioyasakiensis]|uniref:Alkaline phosphatase n=1 Tax=Pseudoalteromonas shioyasakiensis TaxID=1190813 RepID=A0ABT6U3U9_9GAMM|nr:MULTISPECIES: alkaline phosphatase [Pseudoalteromonas]MCO6355387.1 alkaline phosphatase [Pseudoalteromonas shioyasakiensis]MDI4654617.1 alkaline phosphatase [Pseudoalteromonas shioyasakiensis]MDI4670822.1 alkaline phosphatase [Pseudoalteromonas shioyasakiensis]MDI4672161.1 alkaline phosphatase [Pseudoalteromonas shioyasakiensis]MDI4687732.1 alkaline phosphatase [Pseudoalteromonas shioyasakiensis]